MRDAEYFIMTVLKMNMLGQLRWPDWPTYILLTKVRLIGQGRLGKLVKRGMEWSQSTRVLSAWSDWSLAGSRLVSPASLSLTKIKRKKERGGEDRWRLAVVSPLSFRWAKLNLNFPSKKKKKKPLYWSKYDWGPKHQKMEAHKCFPH